jgi:peptidoglycan/xylan/chitin deacetylase (PgdA/CDA1 family)
MEVNNQSRRNFIRTGCLGLGAASMPGSLSSFMVPGKKITHVVSLSFDDGFERSSIKTAEIFEKYKLSACINVIASAHESQFELPNEYHAWPVGDFGLWNELQARGHEIMPHSLRHSNLKEAPLAEAKKLILKCLDIFENKLDSFDPSKAVFNFPYNQSSPEIEAWIVQEVMAFRTGGPEINELPYKGMTRLTCTSYGPENIDEHLESRIQNLLTLPEGWLIYNTHGLDDEGWGPVSSVYLDELLARMSELDHVAALPVGQALMQAHANN